VNKDYHMSKPNKWITAVYFARRTHYKLGICSCV